MDSKLERFTLAEAALLAEDNDSNELLMLMSIKDLDISRKTRIETAKLWVYLCGVENTPHLRDIVMDEAMNDGEMMVRLNMPASEFVDWFRREEWTHFALYEATGDSELWVGTVLDRAHALSKGMGRMARQCPLRRPAAHS